MKKLILALVMSASTGAFAQQVDWKSQLESYKGKLASVSDAGLMGRWAYQAGKVMTTCSASAAVTAATFIADTAPLTAPLAELITKSSNPDYQVYETLLSWESLSATGRGVAGGGVVAIAESLQFVTLWLAGNEAQSYQAIAKIYQSTFATAEAVFAKQGQCMMSIARVSLIRLEMNRRSGAPVHLPALAPLR
jgi:hypothetical protein